MLRYGDSRSQKPDCFGRHSYFNTRDPDCQRCDFFDNCAERIKGGTEPSSRIPVRPSILERDDKRPEMRPTTESGIIKKDESPTDRFIRDCLTGACRGAAWEAYSFFCKFRF